MALSFLFPKLKMLPLEETSDGGLVYFGGAFKTWDQSWDEKHYTSRQIFDHTSKWTNSRQSIATPPYHWHLYQTETFEVVSGTMHYLLDGKENTLKPGKTVNIPPGVPHTFWCEEADGEDLEVLITVRGGPNPGFDGHFVRNFYGFLHSNALQGQTPNMLHAMAYMYDSDVIIQDFPLQTGRAANIALGLVAGKLVGGYSTKHEVYEKTVPADAFTRTSSSS